MAKNYASIQEFIDNSALHYASILRNSRFVGIMDMGTKTSIGYDESFIWNIMKITCPGFKIGVDSKEVDMIPRYYFKNYEIDDLSISYLETSDLMMRKFFHNWLNKILNMHSYDRKYFNDICANTFKIFPLNEHNLITSCDVFEEVVPYDINYIDFDVSEGGENLSLTTVKFKYVRHYMEK